MDSNVSTSLTADAKAPELWVILHAEQKHTFYISRIIFRLVSLAPTHVSWLVGKLVRHTFGFPISGQ